MAPSPSIEPDFLKGCELFENQPPEVLKAVVMQGKRLELGPGDILFRQGDQGDQLYIVKSGVLEVLTKQADSVELTPVAYIGAGEVLGELALLTGSPRSATVRSPEPAELFTVDKPVFLDLMISLPTFARNLCLVLAKRQKQHFPGVKNRPQTHRDRLRRHIPLAVEIARQCSPRDRI